MKRFRITVSAEILLVTVAAFIALVGNQTFWRQLSGIIEPLRVAPWPQYAAFFVVLLAVLSLLFALLSHRRTIKPVLITALILCAGLAYFMDHFGAVIDRHALQSVLETDTREGQEWLTRSMFWHMLWMGALPALAVGFLVEVKDRTWGQATRARLALIAVMVLAFGATLSINFQSMASIARGHRELRDYANPINFINAVRSYYKNTHRGPLVVPKAVAADIQRGKTWQTAPGEKRKPTVFVFVVGESARAASFGLYGYDRDTTPELAKRDVMIFDEVRSCGTNTATSVPCMFSNLHHGDYSEKEARARENLLDTLMRADFDVEWADNNTGSKGVAERAKEVDLADATDAKYCNATGCYDHILVSYLTDRLQTVERDTVIFLHEKGSHGPAYYERYPKHSRKFLPDCRSADLQQCSVEEIRNAYDNTIVYTDRELSELIDALQKVQDRFRVAMLYVSDHGESTGEHGYFLHGAPIFIAPDEQTRVPMILWTAPDFVAHRQLDLACVKRSQANKTSHDAVFPIVLGLLDLQTQAYKAADDPIATCAPRS